MLQWCAKTTGEIMKSFIAFTQTTFFFFLTILRCLVKMLRWFLGCTLLWCCRGLQKGLPNTLWLWFAGTTHATFSFVCVSLTDLWQCQSCLSVAVRETACRSISACHESATSPWALSDRGSPGLTITHTIANMCQIRSGSNRTNSCRIVQAIKQFNPISMPW